MYNYYYHGSSMGTSGSKGLERFIEAQEKDYEIAYKEISKGKKQSHWIWYIYPQIQGLGMSFMDKEYSIKSIKEARDYTKNEKLYNNLIEMTELLLKIEHNNIKEVMWYPDDLKLRSCMTLFFAITGNEIFEKVIDKFYEGEKDLRTINILNKMFIVEENKLNKKFSEDFKKRIDKIEKEEKIKIEKKIQLEKEIKLKEEKEKKLQREKEIILQKEKQKQKENEEKLKENNETNKNINTNSQIKDDKKEENNINKDNDKNKEIKENEKEINDEKDNKEEKEIKDNKNINNNIESNNRIDNKDLCSSEPMDLDEESIKNLKKREINKENIIDDKNNIMVDKLEDEKQDEGPKDNMRNSKDKKTTKIDKKKDEEINL